MDSLGWKAKIGIVAPSTNTSVQPECETLRPAGVTNHFARIHIPERSIADDKAFVEHVAAMAAGIDTAVEQVMTCAPAHLVMGVALEAFSGGLAGAQALEDRLKAQAGVSISMGSTAARAALDAFGAKRIAVLTPHQPRGDAIVRAYLEEAGYDVVRLIGLKCPSPMQIAHVQPPEIRAAFRALDGDDIDAILQVGTNLAGMAVAAEAERWLNKPVLSMNAITYWHALRALGMEDRISGHGRILEEF